MELDSERMTELVRQQWLAVDALDDAQAELAAVNKECSALREERDRLKVDLASAYTTVAHVTDRTRDLQESHAAELELAQAEADYWRKRFAATTDTGLLTEEGGGWTMKPKSTVPQAPMPRTPGAAFGKVDLDWEHDQIHPFTD